MCTFTFTGTKRRWRWHCSGCKFNIQFSIPASVNMWLTTKCLITDIIKDTWIWSMVHTIFIHSYSKHHLRMINKIIASTKIMDIHWVQCKMCVQRLTTLTRVHRFVKHNLKYISTKTNYGDEQKNHCFQMKWLYGTRRASFLPFFAIKHFIQKTFLTESV